jgi:YidC/Oxa1 family membrane protein insertase
MLENMLDYVRFALYALLVMLGFFLYQAWDKEHPRTELPTVAAAATMPVNRYAPAVPSATTTTATNQPTNPISTTPVATTTQASQIVQVTTDLLQVTIDTHGGDIIGARLIKYPESLGSSAPFALLNDDAKTRYVAQSGLLGQLGPDTSEGQAVYTTTATSYTLAPGQNELLVTLNWQNKDGVKVAKVYTFSRDSYEIKVGYNVDNQSTQPWQGSVYTQLMRTNSPPPSTGGVINLSTYFGAAISTPQKPFEKVSFKEMQKNNLNQTVQDGWAAMIQHYFISAWIPPKTATSTYYSKVTPDGLYTIGMISQPLVAAPGAKINAESKLYTGPAVGDLLEQAAPSLKLTIDYGWFWFISQIIF